MTTSCVTDDVPQDRLIQTCREVPFAPAQVFQAFRDPKTLATWWGPHGFTNTFYAFEFAVGGMWRFDMHSPEGKNYANESRFVDIEAPSRIVFDHLGAPRFRTEITFNESETGCRIDWRMVFDDAKTCAAVASFAGDGLEQNLDRLSAAL